jgi:16S rRNA (guanine527-N7)-methyltransferase
VELSPQQVAALEAHYRLLLQWNKTINLTTITALEDAVERHYCESLFLGAHLPSGKLAVVDIGSGAGFPGIPVAILRRDCEVTLVESHQRKAVFLREVTRALVNVRVIWKRAEELDETFDHAISRAVSYAGLNPALKKLGRFANLLTGDEAPASLGFKWNKPIALPWGEARFLRTGSRE